MNYVIERLKEPSTIIIAALALTGCAGITTPADQGKMTPEQLKASARDKSALAGCVSAKTVTGNITSVYVNADQAPKIGSEVTIDADCKTVISTKWVPEPPASAPTMR